MSKPFWSVLWSGDNQSFIAIEMDADSNVSPCLKFDTKEEAIEHYKKELDLNYGQMTSCEGEQCPKKYSCMRYYIECNRHPSVKEKSFGSSYRLEDMSCIYYVPVTIDKLKIAHISGN